jgi:hypothetical protein
MVNFFTVSDSKSHDFARVLINSMHDNLDMEQVNTIFILTVNWTKEQEQYFSKFKKVKLIKDPVSGEGNWAAFVRKKTKYLRAFFESNLECPMILVDVDMAVMKDFLSDLDFNCDFIVCDRDHMFRSQRYIGSFFVACTPRALEFIDLWIGEIGGGGTAIESPALNRALVKYGMQFNYKAALERDYGTTGFTNWDYSVMDPKRVKKYKNENVDEIHLHHSLNAKCTEGEKPYGIHFKSFNNKSYDKNSILGRIKKRSGRFAKEILEKYYYNEI